MLFALVHSLRGSHSSVPVLKFNTNWWLLVHYHVHVATKTELLQGYLSLNYFLVSQEVNNRNQQVQTTKILISL